MKYESKRVKTIKIKNSLEFRKRLLRYSSFLKELERGYSRGIQSHTEEDQWLYADGNGDLFAWGRTENAKKSNKTIRKNIRVIRNLRLDARDLYGAASATKDGTKVMSADKRRPIWEP